MTQAEFDLLPGLLSRGKFMEATGLDEDGVRALVEGGMEVFRFKRVKSRARCEGSRQDAGGPSGGKGKSGRGGGVGYAKYYKSEAAKVAGWALK